MAAVQFVALTNRAKNLRNAPASQLLSIPNYRRLVAAFALGGAAFNIRLMAQSWLVLDITNSKLWVGVVAGASTVAVMAVFLLAMQLVGLGWLLGGAMAEAIGNEATLAAGGLLFILLNVLAYVRSATLRNA